MPQKWYELATKALDDEDEIEKSYPGNLDGKNGYLLMSNEKLLFVREEGFLRKNYELTLDLPYETIGKIMPNGKNKLDIVDVKGVKHEFKPLEISVSIIEKSLEDLRTSAV
jgi:hypothetical protein